MAADPLAALAELVPEAAAALGGARVVRRCEARSTDLYDVSGHLRAGVVLIGDAFHAPCPASGTGMLRILNDVDILAREHLPRWLATPGMGRDKIAGFYADAAKRRLDDASLRTSLRGRGRGGRDRSLLAHAPRRRRGRRPLEGDAGGQGPAGLRRRAPGLEPRTPDPLIGTNCYLKAKASLAPTNLPSGS